MGDQLSKCCNKNTFDLKIPKSELNEDSLPKITITEEKNRRDSSTSIDDFILMDVLGEGGYGKVYLVKKKDNNKLYALKMVKKKLFENTLRPKDAINEKNILVKTNHPFIIQLYFSFQNEKNLFYGMEYAQGGVLFRYIREQKHLPEHVTKFYISQVVLALKYLHEDLNIMYRDLKPENILLDKNGNVKLGDFGLSTSKLKSRENRDTEYLRDIRIHCS